MFDRDWFDRRPHLGGLGVLGAILLSCAVFGLLTYLQGQHSEREKSTAAAYAKAAKQDAERACVGMNSSALFECTYERVEASQEQANTKQDLTAQFRAADSAAFSAFFSLLTLAVSGIGVWYVKRTLDATLKAVEDTGQATEAMLKQNEIAQAGLDIQRRPWLNFTVEPHSVQIWGAQISPHFIVRVTNVGTGINRSFSLITRPYEALMEETREEFFQRRTQVHPDWAGDQICLLPGDTRVFNIGMSIMPDWTDDDDPSYDAVVNIKLVYDWHGGLEPGITCRSYSVRVPVEAGIASPIALSMARQDDYGLILYNLSRDYVR